MPAPKDPQKYAEWIEKLKKRKVWNKGKKLNDPKYAKGGKKNKGRPSPQKGIARGPIHSEETKKRISDKLKGKRQGFANGGKHSETTRKKMSESHTGLSNGPMSEEQKQLLSEIIKKKYEDVEYKDKITQAVRNRDVSKFRDKLSNSVKEFFKTPRGKKVRQEQSERASQRVMDGKWAYSNAKKGYYNSSKAGKVFHRSSYELALYNILDKDEKVVTYLVEKIRIPYEFEGVMRTYIPDCCIIFKDGSELIIEVKPEFQLSDPVNQAKFEAAKALYGEAFEVWTERELEK